MSNNHELFKLITRRCIALPIIAVGVAAAAFLIVFGAVSRQIELVTLGAGALFAEMGTVVAFYFVKKMSEE